MHQEPIIQSFGPGGEFSANSNFLFDKIETKDQETIDQNMNQTNFYNQDSKVETL